MSKLIPPAITLALGLGLGGLNAVAQEERLFRVELLVFSQGNPATANEHWESIPKLAYPSAARFLVEPQRVSKLLKEFGGEGEIDTYGRQLLPLPPEEEQRSGRSAKPAATPAEPAVEQAAPLFQPFYLLEKQQRELAPGARQLVRSGLHKVLFHESWIQPVRDQKTALPIVLDRSGDSGDWPRLQGSIKLHLSRFLHLETNLWLNTAGNYLPGTWRLPPPPLGLPSVLVGGMPLHEARDFIVQREEDKKPPPVPVTRSSSDMFTSVEAVPGEAEEEVEPPWPYRHAVLLQQKRRMRSSEVHYLDHPLLGVVIKLTPVDLEVLAEEAQQAALNTQ